MPNLMDLKELRERLRVSQEEAASWIGKKRSTYTNKEIGNLPTLSWEYDTVKMRLDERMGGRGREVVTSCSAEQKRLGEVCKTIEKLYSVPDSTGLKTFELGLQWTMEMLEQETMMREVLQKLDILLKDNQDFHKRLNTLESLIKFETPGEKVGAGRE